jgi:hypothetical protein
MKNIFKIADHVRKARDSAGKTERAPARPRNAVAYAAVLEILG